MSLNDEDLDALYAADLADFVLERGVLVKRLRSAGRREDAAQARKLAKPNRSAWAANQLVRRYPRQAKRLWAAVDALKEAHLSDPEKLPARRAEEREARIALAEALEVASAAGTISVSPAIRDRALASLRAAAGHPLARPLAEKGMLFEDVADPGLDGLQAALLQGLTPHQGRPEARRPEPEPRNEPKALAANTRTKSAPDSEPKSKPTKSKPDSEPISKPAKSKPDSEPKSEPTNSTPDSEPKSEPTNSTPDSEPKSEPTNSTPDSEPKAPDSPGAERARRRARRGEQERFQRALALAQRELARSEQRLKTARLRADEAARHLANLESQHAQVANRLRALEAKHQAALQGDMTITEPDPES